jgi:hypothetical protein
MSAFSSPRPAEPTVRQAGAWAFILRQAQSVACDLLQKTFKQHRNIAKPRWIKEDEMLGPADRFLRVRSSGKSSVANSMRRTL